ncbi:MAG: DUF1592 domain-containing protein, partial [Verrucomicrobiota bacterium]
VSKGDLNLLDLKFDLADRSNFRLWERVFDRVKQGEMPPKKKKQPDPEDKVAFIEELRKPLYKQDSALKKAEGRVEFRRLTRREYEHTLHDLLAIDIPLRDFLPEDPSIHGFETVSHVQQLSHHTLERYLEAADAALEEAFTRAKRGDEVWEKTFDHKILSQGHKIDGNYRGAQTYDKEAVFYRIGTQFYGRIPITRVKEAGWYEITFQGVHAKNAPEKTNGRVWGQLRRGACTSSNPNMYHVGLVEATSDKRDLTFRSWLDEGDMFELKVADVHIAAPKSISKGGNIYYKKRDLVKEGIAGVAVRGATMKRVYPNGAKRDVSFNLYGKLGKDGINTLEGDAQKEMVRSAVHRFAGRAFRRPIEWKESQAYADIALAALKESDVTTTDALHRGYRAILCSPRFLMFVEPVGALDAYALASRMSYALWVSMPDYQLLQKAESGALADSELMRKEIWRMLQDPKVDRFIESFTDQWLNLKEIDFTTPDRKLHSTFDPVVQESMLAETRGFFKEMVVSNRHINHMISSDYSFLNERMNRFYGFKDVEIEPGAGVKHVKFEGPKLVSGLVTQASLMKVTAAGTTTSPIMRGVFVNERILGIKIPPPPPGIPAVEPDIRGAVSIRDELTKHSSSESCVGCHQKIDPPGFALESLNAVGLYRTAYGTKKTSAKVDPSGVTPQGQEFAGLPEWKKLYRSKPQVLTRAFAQQFLTYATGAEPRFSDRSELTKIVELAEEKKYCTQAIIHLAMDSALFRNK